MVEVWCWSDVYYNIEDAMKQAKKLEDEQGRTEYGISTIDATDMSFYQ